MLNYLATKRPGEFLDIPWHTTNIFMEMEDDANQVPSFFLNGLLHRYDHLKQFKINTAYPNFGLIKGNRGVIFHHGHFIESIYQLMTYLKNLIFPKLEDVPRKVWDLESENFAWIDFFWSTLGRSGEVGQDVEIIYEKMQSEEQFRKLLNSGPHQAELLTLALLPTSIAAFLGVLAQPFRRRRALLLTAGAAALALGAVIALGVEVLA